MGARQAAGTLGRVYLAAIKPFRLAIVYPLLRRTLGRQWEQRGRIVTAEGV